MSNNEIYLLTLIIITSCPTIVLSIYLTYLLSKLEKKQKETEEKHSNKLDVLVRVAAQHDLFINDVKKRAEEIEKANRLRRIR